MGDNVRFYHIQQNQNAYIVLLLIDGTMLYMCALREKGKARTEEEVSRIYNELSPAYKLTFQGTEDQLKNKIRRCERL